MHLGRTLEVASLAHAQYCHDLSRKVEFFAKQGSAIKNWCVGKNLIKHLSAMNSSNNCKMLINELLKVIHFDAEKLLSKIFDFYLKIQNTVQNHNNTSERCIN